MAMVFNVFGLCEFYLADQRLISKENILSNKVKLLVWLMKHFGLVGFIFAYVVMVMRKGSILLPVFRGVVVLDIKSGLILNKPGIFGSYHSLVLKRYHLPSVRVMKEMLAAYLFYRTAWAEDCNFDEGESSDSMTGNRDNVDRFRSKEIYRRAAKNRLYLLWLLNYYTHRSILLNNHEIISTNVSTVITIDEYTPMIAGYISVFAEKGIPIKLYMPLKPVLQSVTLKSLDLFESIIVSNGADADFIKLHYDRSVYLERRFGKEVTLNTETSPVVGIFLSSYYASDVVSLSKLVNDVIVPFIHRVKKRWESNAVMVFCHPNDKRPQEILLQNNICVDSQTERKEGRMTAFDLVVVGNSSVAEEALFHGIPVVYAGFLDSYTRDLYGYVNSGIVFDATESLPSLNDVGAFYEAPKTKRMLGEFCDGTGTHQHIEFINGIIN